LGETVVTADEETDAVDDAVPGAVTVDEGDKVALVLPLSEGLEEMVKDGDEVAEGMLEDDADVHGDGVALAGAERDAVPLTKTLRVNRTELVTVGEFDRAAEGENAYVSLLTAVKVGSKDEVERMEAEEVALVDAESLGEAEAVSFVEKVLELEPEKAAEYELDVEDRLDTVIEKEGFGDADGVEESLLGVVGVNRGLQVAEGDPDAVCKLVVLPLVEESAVKVADGERLIKGDTEEEGESLSVPDNDELRVHRLEADARVDILADDEADIFEVSVCVDVGVEAGLGVKVAMSEAVERRDGLTVEDVIRDGEADTQEDEVKELVLDGSVDGLMKEDRD
jgi:hypothetical protein